ncbi:MAG TPA: hypothetical protein VKS81_07535 [Bacteroidota bacterium]|nr:hypothetical protein [Bacteroidota bacterium]
MKPSIFILSVILFASTCHAQYPCDGSLWKYVYQPERLTILDSCRTVTGVITKRIWVPDGDEHISLRLDPGQPGLLNDYNVNNEDSCLVLEIICRHVRLEPNTWGYCKGCPNKIAIPKKGAHVRVTGTFVVDTKKDHGWQEIHPVYSIEKIK